MMIIMSRKIFENVTNGLATTRNLLNLSDKTAMVVDDGEVNLVMARKSLEQYGIKIITVKSGKECVEIVKKQKIDVIFLDHMMPEMDGIHTLYNLKKRQIQGISVFGRKTKGKTKCNHTL